MMKSAVFLLVLVAVVNSDGEGNFLPADDEGIGNFLAAGDEGEGGFIADGDESEGGFIADGDGDYFTVTRDVEESELDPITAMELALPTRLARLSLNVGTICNTCKRLLRVETRLGAISGKVRIHEIKYSKAGITIRAVRVNPLGTKAASIRLQGGVGKNNAIVTITSKPSAGFHYSVEIWGN